MSIYFYDSYAVIEYLNNNPKFVSYFEDHTGILTLMNILEIYYSVLNESGEEKAEIVLNTLYPLVVSPTKATIRDAMKFKQEYKKKNISYTDCIGYQIAKERQIPFLTGDIQFKGLPKVEFVSR